MNLLNIDNPVASRKLRIGSDDVLVVIGKPELFEDGNDYYCPYSIKQGNDLKVSYAGGMDSVQALQLVMQKIGSDLAYMARTQGVRIDWLDDTPGETGFPA
ncbi:MAG: hypothetical protein ABI886_09195 [Betaproteobacteria bacterium]